jgi:curli biogenesis system outer membrane secretion channel CsgG
MHNRKGKMMFYSRISIFFCLCLVFTCAFLADAQTEASSAPITTEQTDQAPPATASPGRMVVAVDKFENKSTAPTDLFERLRTRITGEIVNTRKFEVVERERMESIIKEQTLIEQGATKADDGPKAGNLKSACYVIYGSVLSLGMDAASGTVGDVTASRSAAKVEIQLSFANAETGKILALKEVIATESKGGLSASGSSASGNMEDQLVESAVRKAAKRVTEELLALVFPSKIIGIDASSVMVNVTQEQTEIGARYEVYDVGEELVDPDTGDSLGAQESRVGEIEVIRSKPKYAEAKPIGGLKIEALAKGMIVRPVDKAVKAKEAAERKTKRTQEFENKF